MMFRGLARGSDSQSTLAAGTDFPNCRLREKNCPILPNFQGAFELSVTPEVPFCLSERVHGRGPLSQTRATGHIPSQEYTENCSVADLQMEGSFAF